MARRSRAAAPQLSADDARGLLATMWRIRCFEERVAKLYRTLQVHGLIHLSIGSEGVAAAVCGRLRDDDAIYSGHRAHGHVLAKGAPMNAVMAELMGRSAGLCQGLGGSMHLVDTAHGVMGATGVVGGNLPMAAGDALSAKLGGTDRVTVVFFGDGAVQAGHFHESVNLAALWDLPLIFVCENNGVAEFTTRAEHSTIERVSDVVAPYGIQRRTVDGGDVQEVWSAAGEFVQAARAGQGPLLLECLTHRFRGHYEGDAQAYRDALAESEWAALDPIVRLQSRATELGWWDEDVPASLEREARGEVETAVAFGRDSQPLDVQAAAELVYAGPGS